MRRTTAGSGRYSRRRYCRGSAAIRQPTTGTARRGAMIPASEEGVPMRVFRGDTRAMCLGFSESPVSRQ